MQDSKKRVYNTGIITFILAIVVIGGILLYNQYIVHLVSDSTNDTLADIVNQQAYNFTSKIRGEMTALEMIGTSIAHSPDIQDIDVETLSKIKEKSAFDYVSIADKEGNSLNNESISVNVSDREFFQRALAGETYLSEPLQSKIRDATIVVLATPILYEQEIIGVLYGSFLAEELDQLFLYSFKGIGYAYVTTLEGEIIAKTVNSYSIIDTNSNNLFDVYKKVNFYAGDDLEKIHKNMAENKSGHSKYNYKGQKRIMDYMSIDMNNWFIFSVVPDAVVSGNANKITFSMAVLSLVFIGVFLLLILRILKVQRIGLQTITRIAFEDELTKLATLAKFKLDAQKLINENQSKQYILIKLDVDNFKMINKIYSYDAGDELLMAIANAIRKQLPKENAMVARFNTDEFIILHEYHAEDQLKQNRANVINTIKEKMGEGFKYNLIMPTGRYVFTAKDIEEDIGVGIERVNFAHRLAKQNKIQIYDYEDTVAESILQDKKIESRMESALQNNEFMVYLQAKYNLYDESIVGAEALVRWQSSDLGLVYPNKFIPLFEENGFITKLDLYMFDKVCGIIRGWIDNKITPIVVSVNFSRNHLVNTDFVEHLCKIADRHQTPRHLLEIELTEYTMFHNENILIEVLERLHAAGFTLSMDDFGSGYSSLGLLKNIPVDVIKIDRSFFMAAANVFRARTVIANIMKMARELGIHTVAEGVETKEHIELLKELGCDIVQGYYYAKPVPERDFTATIKKD